VRDLSESMLRSKAGASVAWIARRLSQESNTINTPSTLLVCVHANGFCKEIWQPIWDLLAESPTLGRQVHALALDLPGHGSSNPMELPATQEQLAVAVLQALDEYKQEASGTLFSHLVGLGHSVGGTSLLAAERARPGSFHSMALIEPILLRRDTSIVPKGDLGAFTLKRRRTFASRQAAMESFQTKANFKQWRRDMLEMYINHGFKDNADGAISLKCLPEQEASIYRMLIPVTYELPDIKCPVTMLNVSRNSGHVPGEVALENFRLLGAPRALHLLPDCSHFMLMEKPELMCEYFSQHLAADTGFRESKL